MNGYGVERDRPRQIKEGGRTRQEKRVDYVIRRTVFSIFVAAFAVVPSVSAVSMAINTSAAMAHDKNCSDFRTQKKAQHYFRTHNPRQDPSGLDADHDGIACEDNPCPCNHHKPHGFVADKAKSQRHRYYYSGYVSGHGSIKLTLQTTPHETKIVGMQVSGLLLNCRGYRATMDVGFADAYSVRVHGGRFDSYGQEQRGGFIATHGHMSPNGKHFTGTIRAHGELYTNRYGWQPGCDSFDRTWKAFLVG